MADAYIGEVRLFAGTYAPQGWFLCDGSQQKVSDYQVLYSLIGTTYGGDGVQYFKLPNLQGALPVGAGQGPNLSAYVLGQMGGSESVTLNPTQMPGHIHPINASTTMATTATPGAGVTFATLDTNYHLYVDTSQGTVTGTTLFSPNMVGPAGNSQPHENRMPCVAINYIICWSGIYPSQ